MNITGKTPLASRRILVTRSADQAGPFRDALTGLGACTVCCPTIEIVPPDDFAELDAAQDDLGRYDFLVLTSTNAVDAFFARLEDSGQDARALVDVCVVAVGPKTAEALTVYGIKADLVPDDFRAEGVVALLQERVTGKRVLYPRAELARDLIPTELAAAGAEVTAPVAYASRMPDEATEQLSAALAAGLDLLTFTASSTVHNLVALADKDQQEQLLQIPVASIGPLTSATCRELGFNVAIEPDNSTLDGMVEAIRNYFEARDAGRGTR